MTGGYKFKNYDRWVKKKKKMTVGLLDTNQTVVIRATIPTIRSLILVVRWSETSIWRRRYGGRQDQSGGIRRSHYFGSYRSHYSDGSVTNYSSMVVRDIDLVTAVRWAARPIQQRLSEPLFWRFGHWTSTTSSSIGRATGVGCLLNI